MDKFASDENDKEKLNYLRAKLLNIRVTGQRINRKKPSKTDGGIGSMVGKMKAKRASTMHTPVDEVLEPASKDVTVRSKKKLKKDV